MSNNETYGLLEKDIKLSLETIVSHCFYSNRMLDRICSLLSVDFVMPITEQILHLGLAHKYPLLADDITNYMANRDCSAIYGETPIGNQVYDSPLDCFKEILEINLKLEKLIKESILLTYEIGDITTMVFLESFLLKIIPITKDILTLVDKSEMYESYSDNWMSFDRDIEKFHLFGVDN